MTIEDDVTNVGTVVPSEPSQKLRRNLGPWQVLGVSIGVIGLSLSANINPQGSIGLVGRAVPLTIVISAVAVFLLVHSFIRLSQHFNTAGSVFGFVGATLGARAGAVGGWCLFGGYLCFGAGSCFAAAVFFNSLLASLNWTSSPPSWLPYIVALVLLTGAMLVAIIPARRGTDLLLWLEGITVMLIMILSIIIMFKLFGHGGPQGQKFTLSVFKPTPGTGTSGLFLGAVYGLLAFIGFEGAATMGEEAERPRKAIPKALLGTVCIAAFFYIFTSAIEVMGYGTTKAGLAAFGSSGSLYGGLGTMYASKWVGDVVTIGTIASAFAGAIGCVVGASRLFFSMTRSAMPNDRRVLEVSTRFGTPVGAILAVFSMMVLLTIGMWVSGLTIFYSWSSTGTVGTLVVLVAYMLTAAGAARMILRSSDVPKWEVIIEFAALLILGYTIYRNIVPYPVGSHAWWPVTSGIWVLIALGAVVLVPGMAKQIGIGLAKESGLSSVGSVEDR